MSQDVSEVDYCPKCGGVVGVDECEDCGWPNERRPAMRVESCATCWPRTCGEPPYRSLCRRRAADAKPAAP